MISKEDCEKLGICPCQECSFSSDKKLCEQSRRRISKELTEFDKGYEKGYQEAKEVYEKAMSVKIDMVMPKSCADCKCEICLERHYWCGIEQGIVDEYVGQRPSWCPLKECK